MKTNEIREIISEQIETNKQYNDLLKFVNKSDKEVCLDDLTEDYIKIKKYCDLKTYLSNIDLYIHKLDVRDDELWHGKALKPILDDFWNNVMRT